MRIKRLVYIALFTTLICVFSVINIPILDVPITLQTMMVMLTGLFLRPIDAFLSILVYLIIGLLGLPVFSNFKSGPIALFGPTGGFILSFPIAAFLISLFKGNKSFLRLVIVNIIFGIILVYLAGSLMLSFHTKINYFVTLKTMIIFIPIDIIKVFFAVLIYDRLKELDIYQ